MSRPTLTPTDSANPPWVAKMNQNFLECLDTPFPMALYADEAALIADANPKLYKECLALVGTVPNCVLYYSDGTVWTTFRARLDFVADLNTGTATVADIKNAYNALLADIQVKGWMD